MTRRIRLKDIAEDLGLAVITISKALRDSPDISAATRARVQEKARDLGYQPNWAARSLAGRQTNVIGMIVPDLVHPFFSAVAKTVSSELRKHDYYVLIASTDEDPALEDEEVRSLVGRQIDGLILASARSSIDAASPVSGLAGSGVPLVLVDRHPSNVRAHYVGVNDRQVGVLAARHLLSRGYRRLAHIGGRQISPAEERLEGFRSEIQEQGMSLPPEYVVQPTSADADPERGGSEAMKRLCTLSQPPDAVFCFNDMIAIGAMGAANELGLSIPKDIAIIGSANVPYGSMLRTSLTTIDQDCVDIGRRAARLMLRLIEQKGQGRLRRLLVEPMLVQRAST